MKTRSLTRMLTRVRRYARAWRQRERRPVLAWRYRLVVARLVLVALTALVACAWCLLSLMRGDLIGALSSAGVGALVASGIGGTLLVGADGR